MGLGVLIYFGRKWDTALTKRLRRFPAVGQTVYVRFVRARPAGFSAVPGRGAKLWPPYERLRNDIDINARSAFIQGTVREIIARQIRVYMDNPGRLHVWILIARRRIHQIGSRA